ncbi:MAG: hypothetical protein HUJ95_07265 [Bacteroidales bacterium]|nr:hypothetical protein [Bacteroidales bacterium]
MKKTLFSLCAACAMILTFSCKKEVPKKDPEPDPTGGFEIVDLGLSVDWASWNVGAKSETESGQYFAWGETAEKENYDWSNPGDYKWGKHDDSASPDYGMTGYNSKDDITTLKPEDDPATVAWGSEWRSPTKSEIYELLDETKCKWKWTTRNGVDGYLITSKVSGFAGKSIFLPATGYRRNFILRDESVGYYWSSSANSSRWREAFYLSFNSSKYEGFYGTRQDGLVVRAVTNPHPERDPTGGVEAVDLGLSVKWASWNVGAKSETDYGINISLNGEYAEPGGLTTIDPRNDPATTKWGSQWRTPTREEFEELIDKTNCEWTWETKKDNDGNDVNGYTVTSKINSKSIFLPAGGGTYAVDGKWTTEGIGVVGWYWSSSYVEKDNNYAYALSFNSTIYSCDPFFISTGTSFVLLSFRAVTK